MNSSHGKSRPLSLFALCDLMENPVLITQYAPEVALNDGLFFEAEALLDKECFKVLYANSALCNTFRVDQRQFFFKKWQSSSLDDRMIPAVGLSSLGFLTEGSKAKMCDIMIEALEESVNKQFHTVTQKASSPGDSFLWKVEVHPFQNRCVCIFSRYLENECLPAPSPRRLEKMEENQDLKDLFLLIESPPQDGKFLYSSVEKYFSEHEEESLSLISETMPQIVWTCKSDGFADYFNKRTIEYTGLDHSKLFGWGWVQILHPDDVHNCLEKYTTHLRLGTKMEYQQRFRKHDGTYRVHLTRAIPLYDKDGKVAKWIGTSTDIEDQVQSERKREKANEDLIKSESHFRQLFESNIIGIAFSHPCGSIFDVNDAFLEITGYEKEEIISEKIGWNELLDPSQLEVVYRYCKGETEAREVTKVELRLISKTGKVVPVLVGFATLEANTIFFVMDITQRKMAETKALDAVKAKSFFIANISHEIRTPMSGIIGMTDMLLDTDLSEQQQEYVSTIKRSSDELLHLINDILDFSKFEAGKVELKETEFNLLSVVEDVVNLLGENANMKGIDLLYHVQDLFRTWTILGDPIRLRQILINLVGNSIKFTEKGGVIIKTHLIEESKMGELVVKLEVKDSGIGISESQIQSLFKPFSQLDNSATRKHSGTGLGLAICKQLVTAFGGEIGVQSEVGSGSVFWFTVRLKCHSVINDTFTSFYNMRPNILIAHPSEAVREILKDSFVSWGVRGHEAESVSQAIRLLNRGDTRYEAIVVCVSFVASLMGQMNVASRGTKLIAFGHLTEISTVENDIDAFLAKPLRQSKVLEVLSNLLSPQAPVRHKKKSSKNSLLDGMKVSPYRVLLAEDNPINQMVAIRQLEKLGYQCVVAENGQQVLDLLDQGTYPLILMDCQMPVMDGINATKEIRKREKLLGRKAIPIIAMTANAMSASIEECFSSGMSDFVSKPVKIETLQRTLQKWLPL